MAPIHTEDLLDPGANAVDRLIPGLEASLHLGFVASPHAGGDDARRSAPRTDRVTEMRPR